MQINRGTLLARLNEAAVGLSSKELIEQSNCFVFKGGRLTTFNDTIMVRVQSPLDFDAVVNATDFMGVVGKFPDDEVEVKLAAGGAEVRVIGAQRKAGIACVTEVTLPLDAVPAPVKWVRLPDGIMGTLKQAARTCADEKSGEYLTTCVHVAPDRVEACDNFRLFRVGGTTGFSAPVLIPAAALAELDGLEISRVSIGSGWVHFKTAGGAEVSVRCSHDKYLEGLDELLNMPGAEPITLPENLAEMVERAGVFDAGGYDAKVGIRIVDGELTITARKETGWFRERKKVKYNGIPLNFEVNPKFLVEVLSRTRDVLVGRERMQIVSGRLQFVVTLVAKDETEME